MEEEVKKDKGLKDAIGEKSVSYVLAGFGLVAGLAWNDAIRSFIEYIFPLEKNSLTAKFVYAVILTLVVVVISVYLVELFKKEEKSKEEIDLAKADKIQKNERGGEE